MPLQLSRRTLLAATALGAAKFNQTRAQTAMPSGPIRIGVLTDESGPYASSGGQGSIFAATMAAQEQGPTILGQPIQIIHADTQNKPDVAGSIARQWYDDGVDAIADLPVTPIAAAVLQVAREKRRTVMITAAAVTEFTSKLCAPISSHWADDTHALAAGATQTLTQEGGSTWSFITVDFSFGAALQAEATKVIEANGGKVLGDAKFPLGNTDFSSQIIQAQSSGAKIVGLVAVGNDQVNLIKQCAEFGMQVGGDQKLAAFLVYLTDIHSLGLQIAQGLTYPTSFYWNLSDATRAFAKRFMAERGAMPTKNQAAIYLATSHFLKCMTQASTRDSIAINATMRANPIDYFGQDVRMRSDGRVLADLTLYRVKPPNQSQAPWDYLTPIGTLPASEAYLPMNPACATA